MFVSEQLCPGAAHEPLTATIVQTRRVPVEREIINVYDVSEI